LVGQDDQSLLLELHQLKGNGIVRVNGAKGATWVQLANIDALYE